MKIETTTRAAQKVLYIRTRTSLEQITAAFDDSFGRITAYLTELGEQPTGGPYGAYYNDDMENLDVEMGFPVSRELPGKGDIQFREIPAIDHAITGTHQGSYNSLDRTYAPLYQHISENKLAMTGPHFDFYINDPGTTPEGELMTEVVIPVSREPMVFCQSCGMPMGQDELFGTRQDGGKCEDYCVYCYKDGAFTADMSMDEMIDISLKHMKEMYQNDPSFDGDTALENMRSFFPMLKRWKV